MPMSLRPCSTPGCEAVTTGRRCPLHQQRARRDDRARTSPYQTAEHQAFRAAVLTADPVCVLCHSQPSVMADHHPRSRKQLVAAGLNPNDPQHGRGLCWPCHSRETAKRQPGGWNAERLT